MGHLTLTTIATIPYQRKYSANINITNDTALYNIIRPRRSRSAAAHSDQTFPRMICRSVRRCVVCLSSALWKNGESDLDAFGIIGRTGPGMRQVMGFGDRSTGRGTFGVRVR